MLLLPAVHAAGQSVDLENLRDSIELRLEPTPSIPTAVEIGGYVPESISLWNANRPFALSQSAARASSLGGKLAVTLGTTAGWDGNAVSRPDAEGAAFWTASLKLEWSYESGNDKFVLNFNPDIKIYDSSNKGADELNTAGFAQWVRKLDDTSSISLRLSDAYTLVNRDPFLHSLAARVGYQRKLSGGWTLDGTYTASYLEYLLPVAASVRDPDAIRQAIGINATLVPESKSSFARLLKKLTLGYTLTLNQADGADVDYTGHRLRVGLEQIRFWEAESLAVDLAYLHDFNNYSNVNSQLGNAKRDDDADAFTVQINWKPALTSSGEVVLYARYELRDQDSNIASRNFGQSVVTAGLSLTF